MNTKTTEILSEEKRLYLHHQLQAMLKTLKKTEHLLEKAERGQYTGERIGEVSHIPLHNADFGTDESFRQINAQIAKGEIKEIQLIEDAIRRIEKGTYGLCENCEEPISPSRLYALPEARFCIECEKTWEDTEKKRRNRGFVNESGFIYKQDYSKKGFQ